ncbi:uncharacterized protein LOC118180427 [Stegodyphus dumicola]|uniref:uncharacterized protein LOC118180427 n=1 Tax=Stegodyphus dumicola TaxID=202533 RepID=UPI0015AC89FA|nr:uncharacterized protein LOC118180427 [Stegodyphus dumicola]
MPDVQPSMVEDKAEANRVSVKIPPFWVDKPEIWFYQVEAQFAISGITSEETKFNYLVAQLEPRFIENIWDIIKDAGTNKYSAAKARLMQTFKESENLKIKRLLTGLELGDTKPSQLLRRMRSLGDTDDISDKVLRTLWLEKMPDAVKHVLIVSDENLEKLATMADKILEMQPRAELASVNKNTVPVDELLNKISALELQIANMTARNSRSRYRSPSGNRSTSRNRSRKRFNPNGKYCYYHFKFGEKCFPEKCKEPCSWKQSENMNQQ